MEHVLYHQPQLEASVLDLSSISIQDCKEKRRSQLKKGYKKFKTHQTEQTKEVETKLHAEKMAASGASLSPELKEAQQEKDAEREKKERATIDAQTKEAKKNLDTERKTKYIEGLNAQQHGVVQQHHVQTQAKLREAMTPWPEEKKKHMRS